MFKAAGEKLPAAFSWQDGWALPENRGAFRRMCVYIVMRRIAPSAHPTYNAAVRGFTATIR